ACQYPVSDNGAFQTHVAVDSEAASQLRPLFSRFGDEAIPFSGRLRNARWDSMRTVAFPLIFKKSIPTEIDQSIHVGTPSVAAWKSRTPCSKTLLGIEMGNGRKEGRVGLEAQVVRTDVPPSFRQRQLSSAYSFDEAPRRASASGRG